MKPWYLLLLSLSLYCTTKGQALVHVYDDFLDGNFAENPTWQGDTTAFVILPENGGILRSNVDSAATCYISTPCTALDSTEWNLTASFEYSTSSVNYSVFYVAMDASSPQTSKHAYYIRMGNTQDNISLYYRENGKSTCLIQGREGLLEAAHSKVHVRLTHNNGTWTLYTQKLHEPTEIEPMEEGNIKHTKMTTSAYCALSYTCSKTRSKSFFFDNLDIFGREGYTPPADTLTTPPVEETDTATLDDLRINEIMYEPLSEQQEYAEIINRTPLALSLNGWRLTTRKKDGSFNSGNRFPEGSYILPYGMAALCKDEHTLHEQFQIPDTAIIYSCNWGQSLNNDGTTLYLLNPDGIVADSVPYEPAWQHPLVRGEKGVALERIHPDLPSDQSDTWMSAASTHLYGTPGYCNSQYIDLSSHENEETISIEPETFSPDGDGINDIAIIHCHFPQSGYVVNIRIFTPTGILVTQVANNALTSENEQFIWDGTTLQDNNAEIGIYALVLEAYQPETGKRFKKKLPIIVHGR